jgi:hypothetical protein
MEKSRSKRLMRTTDLTLAAYLIQEHEFDYELVEMDGEDVKPGHPQGAWEFEETPALSQVVDDFNAGKAKVEPQAFHQMVNRTRKDMFNFLGIGS